jgi:hypothetical protein
MMIALLLAACAGPTPTEPVVVTQNPNLPTQSSSNPTTYPGPVVATVVSIAQVYPAPNTPGLAATQVIPPSGYEPQPGDGSLIRDQVFLDLPNSRLLTTGTQPLQVSAILSGNLSDPCHQLRVVVTPADTQNKINLEVYSVLDRATACITVLQPFAATIPLGSYSAGHYSVYVNNELLGEFGTGYDPQPGDASLTRGDVFLDLANSQLLSLETYPIQVRAILRGNLSDPCHQLRVVVTPADAQNKINLDVYSVFDRSTACITVLQPFEASIPLGSFSGGHYSVYVNGQLLGEFDS